jgi:hypothetical protein
MDYARLTKSSQILLAKNEVHPLFLVLSSWTGLPFLCNEVRREKKKENGWQFLHERNTGSQISNNNF